MPESEYFKRQKKKGRWFEAEVEKVLIEKGMQVIDPEKLKYQQKRGWDREVIINGERCKVEMKYDSMSLLTGNVCLEIGAIRQSVSPIWIYGIPDQGKVNVYSMLLKDLAPFAESYPVKKLVGEFSIPAAIVSKSVFISQLDASHSFISSKN
jgi:hypothetical protein